MPSSGLVLRHRARIAKWFFLVGESQTVRWEGGLEAARVGAVGATMVVTFAWELRRMRAIPTGYLRVGVEVGVAETCSCRMQLRECMNVCWLGVLHDCLDW